MSRNCFEYATCRYEMHLKKIQWWPFLFAYEDAAKEKPYWAHCVTESCPRTEVLYFHIQYVDGNGTGLKWKQKGKTFKKVFRFFARSPLIELQFLNGNQKGWHPIYKSICCYIRLPDLPEGHQHQLLSRFRVVHQQTQHENSCLYLYCSFLSSGSFAADKDYRWHFAAKRQQGQVFHSCSSCAGCWYRRESSKRYFLLVFSIMGVT